MVAVAAGGLQKDVVDKVLSVAFRIEPVARPTFQIKQVLGHVLVQIVFRRGLLFIVPVGLFVHPDRLAAPETYAHFLHAQQVTLFVGHPGVVRRVYPKPLAESGRIDSVNDVAIVDVRLWHAGDDARRNTHRQVTLVQHRSQSAAVQTSAAVLAGLSKVDGVVSTLRITVLPVVAYLVVDIGQDAFDGAQFVARHGHAVQPEIVTDALQVGLVGLRIDNPGQAVYRLRAGVFRRILQNIKIIGGFFQTLQGGL